MTELRQDTIPDDDYTPLDAGWDARLKGIRMSENPYAINNWKHYEWEKGWKQANESCEDAPELYV